MTPGFRNITLECFFSHIVFIGWRSNILAESKVSRYRFRRMVSENLGTISLRFISFLKSRVAVFRLFSYRFFELLFPYRFISFHIVHIVSYRLISFHIVSYRFSLLKREGSGGEILKEGTRNLFAKGAHVLLNTVRVDALENQCVRPPSCDKTQMMVTSCIKHLTQFRKAKLVSNLATSVFHVLSKPTTT